MKSRAAKLMTSIAVPLFWLNVDCGSEDCATSSNGSFDAGSDGGLDGMEEAEESTNDATQEGGDSDAQLGFDAEAPPDSACLVVDPYPSTLENPASLEETQGELRFVARNGSALTAYTHRSASFVAETGRIVFVMHGADRNAAGYLDAWRDLVEKHGALALVLADQAIRPVLHVAIPVAIVIGG